MQDAFETLSFAAKAAFLAASLRYANGDLNQSQFLAIWLFLLLRFHAIAVTLGRLHAGNQESDTSVLEWIGSQPKDSVDLHVQDGKPAKKQGNPGDYSFDTSASDIWQKKAEEWFLLGSLAVDGSSPTSPGSDLIGVVSDGDLDAAMDAVSVQRSFSESFAEAIESGGYETANGTGETVTNTDAVTRRSDAYVIALRVTANKAWADAQPDGTLFNWVLGAAEKHCADCPAWAAAGPYKADELPAWPGDGTSECSIGCKCDLETVDGETGLQHYLPDEDEPDAKNSSDIHIALDTDGSGASKSVIPMSNDNTQARRLLKAYEVKDATMEGNTLRGFPSAIGNLDSYSDVIFPKAFRTALPQFLKDGFVPTDHEWHWTALVAMPVVAEERGNKLYSECVFHTTPDAQAAKQKCLERMARNLAVGLSIGFTIAPGGYIYFADGKDLLSYARRNGYDMTLFDTAALEAWTDPCCGIITIEKLFEYSLTPAPANTSALAIDIKSYTGSNPVLLGLTAARRNAQGDSATERPNMHLKSVCGKRGLPLADKDHAWDGSAADKRVRAWADAEDAPNAKYADAFVIQDGDADQFGSYKLPFADVIDGKLQAVPKGIYAAAGAINGARGGVDLPDGDADKAKSFLSSYYEKLGEKAPWDKDGDGKSRVSHAKFKGQYLGDVEYEMCLDSMYSGFCALYMAVGDCIAGYGDYAGMSMDERKAHLDGMHEEYHDLCNKIYDAMLSDPMLGGDGYEDLDDARKSINKRLMTICSLGDGLPYNKQLSLVVDMGVEVLARTKARHEMRLKAGRELSQENWNALDTHRGNLAAVLDGLSDLLERTKPKTEDDTAEEKAARDTELHRLKAQHLRNICRVAIAA